MRHGPTKNLINIIQINYETAKRTQNLIKSVESFSKSVKNGFSSVVFSANKAVKQTKSAKRVTVNFAQPQTDDREMTREDHRRSLKIVNNNE